MCAVLVGFAAMLPACSDAKSDVEVTLDTNPYWGSLMYTVQATADEVQITGVSINRGNCKVPPGTAAELERTVSLKFGQTWKGYAPGCKVGDVKEMEITTGRGTFTFGF